MTKMIFNCTNFENDPERATLPFVAANVAATAGREAVVFCTIDAVWIGTEGGAQKVEGKGLPPLKGLMQEFVGNGGEVWLCGACTKPRGIVETNLVKGATIVGAARLVEEIAKGGTAVSVG